MRRVAVITTGGTIASRYDAATDRTRTSDTGEALIRLLPRRPRGVEVVLEDFAQIHSFNFRFEDVVQLAARVRGMLATNEIVGAVVTQGTDTLEESSYLLGILVDTPKPIVLTGAQLPADHPQSDGPRNLVDAIDAAGAAELNNFGALVCFNGTLHAARDVAKVHTSALETFTSLGHGHVGIVDEGEVVLYRRLKASPRYAVDTLRGRVPLIKLTMDAEPLLVDASVDAGVDGLVIEAFGRGNVTAAVGDSIRRAIMNRVPVVVTSRCPQGRVKPIYGTGGGGRELEDMGVIFAGDLKGPKARCLLLVLVNAGLSVEEIRHEFALNAL